MAQLSRESTRPFTSDPAFEADATPFGTDGASEHLEYRAPRRSRLRSLGGAFLLAILCGGLIAASWLAWTPVLDAVAEAAATLSGREGDGQTQVTATIALASLAILGFVLAWWRASSPQRAVRLSEERGRMAVDAIGGELRGLILESPAVREAEVRIENRGRGRIRVRAWLRIFPEARIDDVLDGVDEAAEWLISSRLGLRLSEPPLAEVQYDELDLRAGRSLAATLPRDAQTDDEDA